MLTAASPRLDLTDVLSEVLQPGAKGIPTDAAIRVGDIGRAGWNLLAGDLPFPVAVLRRSAVEHNSRWMAQFAERTGMRLCPHGKTSMAPQLIDRQLADGAWGVTAATTAHIHTYLRFGVRRILHANQLAGRENIRGVFAALAAQPDVDFYTLIDSEAGLHALIEGLRLTPIGRPLKLLVEVGASGGRTGVRRPDDAILLAQAVANAAPVVALHGLECYEGVYSGRRPQDEEGAERLLSQAADIAQAVLERGLFACDRPILSAGGSAFYDLVARDYGSTDVAARFDPILRSGCYLTHDSHHYEVIFERIRQRSPDLVERDRLKAALEVWGVVQSTPEPGLALVGLGKRDISYDIDLPLPLLSHRPGAPSAPTSLGADYVTQALADQHLFLSIPKDSELRVGDLVAFGVSHPCTTFDKWQVLLMVEDDYTVTSAIKTFF